MRPGPWESRNTGNGRLMNCVTSIDLVQDLTGAYFSSVREAVDEQGGSVFE